MGTGKGFKRGDQETLQIRLKVTHPLMTWLVKHATWLYNRYQLHGDGKTSYERRWGRSYQRPIVTFAETVAFKYAATTKNKTTPDWDYGIWLGKCTQSDEHYVSTAQAVYRSRSIRRLPPSNRYDRELFITIETTPWRPRGLRKEPNPRFVLEGAQPHELQIEGEVPPNVENDEANEEDIQAADGNDHAVKRPNDDEQTDVTRPKVELQQGEKRERSEDSMVDDPPRVYNE